MKKALKKLSVGVLVALLLVIVGTKVIHADGFWNCVTIWWETNCYWVEPEDPTGDGLFQAMYALCQFLGLCP